MHRFGTFPGYGCHVSFMLARHIGVVVLVNNSRTGMLFADIVANAVYDQLSGRVDAGARMDAALDSLRARMGVAESKVEVYDATKDKLRVELFGGGGVVEAVFPEGAAQASELKLEGASFRRR